MTETESNQLEGEVLQVKMDMKGVTRDMFLALKKHYNLGFNSELIRLLIKKEYDNIMTPE